MCTDIKIFNSWGVGAVPPKPVNFYFSKMKEIQLTNGGVALVDDEDYERLNKWSWYAHDKGKTKYAICHYKKKAFHIMHRMILDAPKGMLVDHADHNGLNNQKSNLRLCNYSQNNSNRLNYPHKSQYKGVSFLNNGYGIYIRARIKVNNKEVHIGYYETEEDAARAYDRMAIKTKGEFALLNFPYDNYE